MQILCRLCRIRKWSLLRRECERDLRRRMFVWILNFVCAHVQLKVLEEEVVVQQQEEEEEEDEEEQASARDCHRICGGGTLWWA
jgi:hypothetical protein